MTLAVEANVILSRSEYANFTKTGKLTERGCHKVEKLRSQVQSLLDRRSRLAGTVTVDPSSIRPIVTDPAPEPQAQAVPTATP